MKLKTSNFAFEFRVYPHDFSLFKITKKFLELSVLLLWTPEQNSLIISGLLTSKSINWNYVKIEYCTCYNLPILFWAACMSTAIDAFLSGVDFSWDQPFTHTHFPNFFFSSVRYRLLFFVNLSGFLKLHKWSLWYKLCF